MDKETRRKLATELGEVYSSGKPVEPLIARYPDMDLDDAYAIQQFQVEDWEAAGRKIRGRKVGLTSLAMQNQLGVDQPDYGVLMEDFFVSENTPIPASNFVQPRVEPEVAFLLKKTLSGPGLNPAEAFDAIEWVFPALEIIDSRIKEWKIGFFDTISDNASSGGVVLGSSGKRPDQVDLNRMGVNVYVNSVLTATGAGSAVLGSPINALTWLANTLGARGIALEAGHVILPGSVTRALDVGAGVTVSADFAGLGNVTAPFV